MKKIIFTRPDGGLSVIHPVINTHALVKGVLVPSPENITPEEAVKRAWKDVPPDAIGPQEVDESLIPQDRTFRNAWKAGSGRVDHDMDKCRELHKQRLRELRAPKLAALDIAYMRADEAGNTALKASIATQKVALRDVTEDPAILAAKTPEELKLVLPEILR